MIHLKKIKLGNFKCFSDETNLEFGKLTLLTGANSTGKSSLVYGVLGALQSPRFPYEFSANGRYINMGNFSEMVYAHDKTLPMTVGFTLAENDFILELTTTWSNNEISNQAVLMEYEAHSPSFEFIVRRQDNNEGNDYLLTLDNRPQDAQKRDFHRLELLMTDIYHTAELFKAFPNKENWIDDYLAGYKEHTSVNNILLKVSDSGVICPNNTKASVAFGLINRQIADMIRRYQDKMNFYPLFSNN